MKKVLFGIIVATALTGCIEVTRGYKSTVFMKVEGESKSTYTASPKLDVNADKEYSDAFKAKADLSENNNTPAESKEVKESTETKNDK